MLTAPRTIYPSRPAVANAAAAAASSPMQAVFRMASHCIASSGGSSLVLGAGTLLGRALDHMFKRSNETAAAVAPAAAIIDADLLAALLVFAIAALLDAVDGHVARAYNQCSAFGVVLDVVADNVLRACLWMTAALLDARFALPAVGFVACEWLTLLASQVCMDGGRPCACCAKWRGTMVTDGQSTQALI